MLGKRSVSAESLWSYCEVCTLDIHAMYIVRELHLNFLLPIVSCDLATHDHCFYTIAQVTLPFGCRVCSHLNLSATTIKCVLHNALATLGHIQ